MYFIVSVQQLCSLFPVRLLALHPCPHATVSWSPMVGGMRQYINQERYTFGRRQNTVNPHSVDTLPLWTSHHCGYPAVETFCAARLFMCYLRTHGHTYFHKTGHLAIGHFLCGP